MGRRAQPGSPEPLGATPLAGGTNFAVFSATATAIEVCLFDAAGEGEIARVPLLERTGDVFHGFIPGVTLGARYGLRAHGPYAPAEGHRFDPSKLLVDPYAVAIDRPFDLHPTMFDQRQGETEPGYDDLDSAPYMPKAVVAAPETMGVRAAWVPWPQTVIYELHVRGFTMRHPDVAPETRGTFAALADPAAIAHLVDLGVTTVEVMPAAAWIDERHLPPLGLSNYWGYNPVALMTPDPRLAPGGWDEIAAATAALAAAGIETIVDVVFNHTGEGDALGPTLSFRGLDTAGYYRLTADGRYVDDSGCGDTLALDHPATVRLVTDTLRTWARRGGVSGFRFDLATVMGRHATGFDPAAPLLTAIAQDPELRTLKLIAEPWDCGPGGYRLGDFPAEWGEWNDRFRDSARRFWRGDGGALGELASRLAGSQDLIASHRRPSRSVNFVTAHDGFTLADLVAYSAKHNEANGEHNRDGSSHEISWDNGVEGPTADADAIEARRRDQRALLATLMLARGTPMLAMGAELSHSQSGNNNAYCQDNELAWLDWNRPDDGLTAYVGKLARLRRDHPALHADRFLAGRAAGVSPYPDVAWHTAEGWPTAAEHWSDDGRDILVVVLADPHGDDEHPDRLAVVFNRGRAPARVALPTPHSDHAWRIALDSTDDEPAGLGDDGLTVAARSVTVLAEDHIPAGLSQSLNQPRLDKLAEAAGIASEWWSVDGVRHAVSPETQRALLKAM
ncbi:MAG: glycogen debranching protein GlgX, partial [Caulobacteraceae bacterium]